jgi:hypothetical protein
VFTSPTNNVHFADEHVNGVHFVDEQVNVVHFAADDAGDG